MCNYLNEFLVHNSISLTLLCIMIISGNHVTRKLIRVTFLRVNLQQRLIHCLSQQENTFCSG